MALSKIGSAGLDTLSGNLIVEGNVGVGTSSPDSNLHVLSTTLPQVKIDYNGTYYTTISNNGALNVVDPGTDNKWVFLRNGTEQMRIDSAGRVTMPYQPSFRAYLSTEWATVGATINSGWTTQYDRGNNFNQGTFTAPVAGSYWFSIMWDSLSAQGAIELRVNGQPYARWEPTGRTDDSWESHYYSTPVYLQASDFVTLYLSTGGGSNPIHMGSGHWGHFGGHLIG